MKSLSKLMIMILLIGSGVISCQNDSGKRSSTTDEFTYIVDKFEDIQVIKFKLPAFEELSLQQKELIYYLGEAALCGRDIFWAQNFKYNLKIRKTIEAILESYNGDRESEDFKSFITYSKRVFFANGIHHHYSNDKFIPGFTSDYFAELIAGTDAALLPADDYDVDALVSELIPILFDPTLFPKKMEQGTGIDLVTGSSVNFYEGVTQAEVEKFYSEMVDPNDQWPISYGLNTKLVKVDRKSVV